MIEIGMPLEYQVVIVRLYEQVRFQLKIENSFSEYFFSNMGLSKDVHYHLHSLVYALIN